MSWGIILLLLIMQLGMRTFSLTILRASAIL